MIVPPSKVFDRIISEYIDRKIQEQQAGIDLTLKDVYYFIGYGRIDFDNKHRKLAQTLKIEFDDKAHLSQGVYKISLNEYLKIDNRTLGIFFPRTSLLRNGVAIYSGLFDPGFEGYAEMLMHVINPNGIEIYRNARVGQIVFLRSRSSFREYSGIYRTKRGK